MKLESCASKKISDRKLDVIGAFRKSFLKFSLLKMYTGKTEEKPITGKFTDQQFSTKTIKILFLDIRIRKFKTKFF